jgi:hypothetical protein
MLFLGVFLNGSSLISISWTREYEGREHRTDEFTFSFYNHRLSNTGLVKKFVFNLSSIADNLEILAEKFAILHFFHYLCAQNINPKTSWILV